MIDNTAYSRFEHIHEIKIDIKNNIIKMLKATPGHEVSFYDESNVFFDEFAK